MGTFARNGARCPVIVLSMVTLMQMKGCLFFKRFSFNKTIISDIFVIKYKKSNDFRTHWVLNSTPDFPETGWEANVHAGSEGLLKEKLTIETDMQIWVTRVGGPGKKSYFAHLNLTS